MSRRPQQKVKSLHSVTDLKDNLSDSVLNLRVDIFLSYLIDRYCDSYSSPDFDAEIVFTAKAFLASQMELHQSALNNSTTAMLNYLTLNDHLLE